MCMMLGWEMFSMMSLSISASLIAMVIWALFLISISFIANRCPLLLCSNS